MDQSFLDGITKTLGEFARSNSSAQALEVKGPIREGLSYRWRLVSNRYKEVTVLLITKKPVFGRPSPTRFEVYGFEQTKDLAPNVEDLQSFLGTSELRS